MKFYKEYLIHQFGSKDGNAIFKKAYSALEKLKSEAEYKEKDHERYMNNSILPAIAFYNELTKYLKSKEKALKHMESCIWNNTRNNSRKQYEKLGKFPFFFGLFRKMFSTGLKNKSWDVDITSNNKELFEYTIKKCLWADKFKEYSCPELCHIFCHNDEINFINVSKYMTFERTSTLANGDCCDFRFYKNK
ncbi:MAG: hypothetical protein E7208_07820 [Clostridium butyricum]|nr:hypothetical protein [Clostridium butyricum]